MIKLSNYLTEYGKKLTKSEKKELKKYLLKMDDVYKIKLSNLNRTNHGDKNESSK